MLGRSLTDARLAKKAMASIDEAVIAPRLLGANGELANLPEFLSVDLAHVVMLTSTGILAAERGGLLIGALDALRQEGPSAIQLDPSYGTLLLQVERFLAARVGPDAGGMLQLARSRIDQGATIARVSVRDRILAAQTRLAELQARILHRAGEWQGVLTPGYTHIQHSQPWDMAHYALACFDGFQRDVDRLWQCYDRVNRNPLGTAAMAGTGWPVDRDMTAELLGFDSVIRNAKDASFIGGMDFIPETASVLSLLMANLGRWASELYVWSSFEFGLVELDDGLCGTSSLMPQKKNAYALERVRALSGEALGWMPAQLGLLRSPTSTDCDFNFSSREHFGYFRATDYALHLMADVVGTLRINTDLMAARAGANWSTASELADTIVRERGLAFRHAHHVVGALVRRALDEGLAPADVTTHQVDEAAVAMLGHPLGLPADVVRNALDAAAFVRSRHSAGSVNPDEVARLLALAHDDLAANRATLANRLEKVSAAASLLDARIAALAITPSKDG